MVDANQSGCINHPGVTATHRCKQCGKPVCNACTVSGPTGVFCCAACKEKHQAFAQRAQELDGKARGSFFPKLRGMLGTVAIILAVCLALGVVGSMFYVPVLSDLVFTVRGIIGP